MRKMTRGGRNKWNVVEAHNISECTGFVINIVICGGNFPKLVK